MKVRVCGGRDYSNYQTLEINLGRIHQEHPISTIIHGAARGADSLADRWAKSGNLPVQEFPAQWHRQDDPVRREQRREPYHRPDERQYRPTHQVRYLNNHRRFSRVNKELLAELGTVQDVEGELNSTFGNILPENIARMAVNEITNAPERQDWDRDWKELEIDTESDSDTKVHVDTKFIQQEANANWELTAQAARIPRSPPTPDEPRTKPG